MEADSSAAVFCDDLSAPSADENRCSELQKALGHGAAYTGAATGDENAFALQKIVGEHGAPSERYKPNTRSGCVV